MNDVIKREGSRRIAPHDLFGGGESDRLISIRGHQMPENGSRTLIGRLSRGATVSPADQPRATAFELDSKILV